MSIVGNAKLTKTTGQTARKNNLFQFASHVRSKTRIKEKASFGVVFFIQKWTLSELESHLQPLINRQFLRLAVFDHKPNRKCVNPMVLN